uniref:Uncharacterized protein LOC114346352 isoform X2 n=1 Tax=Diabrotica virgifera virgifera TaxID=50390 RepID=A0A6P7GSW8_DIAVI
MHGYAYMNGDVGKVPSGVVFSTAPESSSAMGTHPDYVAVNGVAEGAEGPSPLTPSAPQENASQSQSAYPLPQLKQMLAQQLEYYFSSCIQCWCGEAIFFIWSSSLEIEE